MPPQPTPSRHQTTVIAVAAMCVALIALVFSLSGFAFAKPDHPAKGGVWLVTTATGTMEVVAGPSEQQLDFPLDNAAFTQPAGKTMLLVASLSSPDLLGAEGEGDCSATVAFWRDPSSEFPDFIQISKLSEWHGRSVLGLVSSDAAIPYTLEASVNAWCDSPFAGRGPAGRELGRIDSVQSDLADPWRTR